MYPTCGDGWSPCRFRVRDVDPASLLQVSDQLSVSDLHRQYACWPWHCMLLLRLMLHGPLISPSLLVLQWCVARVLSENIFLASVGFFTSSATHPSPYIYPSIYYFYYHFYCFSFLIISPSELLTTSTWKFVNNNKVYYLQIFNHIPHIITCTPSSSSSIFLVTGSKIIHGVPGDLFQEGSYKSSNNVCPPATPDRGHR